MSQIGFFRKENDGLECPGLDQALYLYSLTEPIETYRCLILAAQPMILNERTIVQEAHASHDTSDGIPQQGRNLRLGGSQLRLPACHTAPVL